jgi:hypothetical protein
MVRFFAGLAAGIFFFTKIDILIWQRIFEKNQLWDLGIGPYHQGWIFALYGFMALGFIFFYPHLRRMVMFPLSLALLAFSGLEDVLYYWLDGRAIPATLPWLDNNARILQPVTSIHLVLSAVVWVLVIVLLEILGTRLDLKISKMKVVINRRPDIILSRWLPWFAGKKEEAGEVPVTVTDA